MARQLRVGDDDLINLRSAALLHDIGHGPFSHVFEAPLKEINGPEATHEEITRRLIGGEEGIVSVLGERTDEVIALLSEDQNGVLHQIISGNIDADKMDYLRRDSYHAGVTYGNFDLERVLYTLRKTQNGSHEDLTIHEKGIDAVESFRLARFLMYAQVYYHHTNVVANGMLQRALSVAIRDKVVEAERMRTSDSSFLQYYLALDDARLLSQVLSKPESTAAGLVRRLERRDLLKRGYESDISQERDLHLRYQLGTKFTPDMAQEIETAVAAECGCDPDLIIAGVVKNENSLFKSASVLLEEEKFPILIETKNGEVQLIDSFSTLTYTGNPRTTFYLFCPEEHRQRVQACAGDVIASTIG